MRTASEMLSHSLNDASCLMTDAPNVVDDKQLEELCLEVSKSEQEQ